MNFEFATATRIVFGSDAAQQAAALVKTFGWRALLVTGRNPERAVNLTTSLATAGICVVPFPVAGEPEIATVENGVARAREENCDCVVSLGGGSVIDAGKAIAAMLANDGKLLDYLEVIGWSKSLTRPSVPFIAIPTTAGTGAEVTRNAVLAAPAHKVKVSLRSPLMLPRVAIVDPDLTQDLPPALTASTGLDALTQLIEPFVCGRANPLTDGFCEQGIPRVARSLRVAVANGFNRDAREDMALASLFGGLALANAGLGAVHGFAGPIGGQFPAPHGAICAALLPSVMAANLRALRAREPENPALLRYRRVAALLTSDARATADDGVAWVQKLIADLPVARLGEFGIHNEHVPDLVAQAQKASSMKANPIVLTPEELAATLRQAL